MFAHHVVVLLLIVYLLIGYRRLREMDYYRDDPMVKRLLGLNRIPDVVTVSRALANLDKESIERIRQLCRAMVIERLSKNSLYRLTLDFDVSVCSTQGRGIKGTAAGFNKKKRGPGVITLWFVPPPRRGEVPRNPKINSRQMTNFI
jgi:hypothetical protein